MVQVKGRASSIAALPFITIIDPIAAIHAQIGIVAAFDHASVLREAEKLVASRADKRLLRPLIVPISRDCVAVEGVPVHHQAPRRADPANWISAATNGMPQTMSAGTSSPSAP